jgi:cation-transporting ATPase E
MQNEPVVLYGLSEREAAERRARGLGNDARLKTGRTYGQIVRENLLTFFNLVLFGLGGILLLLGSPRDAFFTAAIGWVNALIATAQEVRAKIKLDRIAVLARPRAVVIREGQEKEVDPSAV